MSTDRYAELLTRWGAAELQAIRAEDAISNMKQATADPAVAQLFQDAQRLRAEANALFKELRAEGERKRG